MNDTLYVCRGSFRSLIVLVVFSLKIGTENTTRASKTRNRESEREMCALSQWDFAASLIWIYFRYSLNFSCFFFNVSKHADKDGTVHNKHTRTHTQRSGFGNEEKRYLRLSIHTIKVVRMPAAHWFMSASRYTLSVSFPLSLYMFSFCSFLIRGFISISYILFLWFSISFYFIQYILYWIDKCVQLTLSIAHI